MGVGAAGGSREVEGERLAVAAGPFGDDAAVVVAGEFGLLVQGSGRVGAVHP